MLSTVYLFYLLDRTKNYQYQFSYENCSLNLLPLTFFVSEKVSFVLRENVMKFQLY